MDQITDHPSLDAEPTAPAPVAEPVQPVIDKEMLKRLGVKLARDFTDYEQDRRMAELQWTKNYRQYLGVYDPEIEGQLAKDRSRAYPKLTRVKCVSMLSRLMNLMFPSGEKNWTIEASPVPNLDEADLAQVLAGVQQQGQSVTNEMIEQAVVDFATQRARNLEKEIEDQLTCAGGSKLLDYVMMCRKVMMSGIVYGMGVLKGPMARPDVQRRWQQGPDGVYRPLTVNTVMPQFEFVPIWDYYPDMSAKYLHQMDGQFQRVVMSKSQVRELADNPEFFGDVIKAYLADNPKGNYKEKPFESELRTMGVQTNVRQNDGRKYELLVWDGFLSADYLKAAGAVIPDDKMADSVKGIVWLLDGQVVRATLNPWLMLEEEERINTFHVFIFEEDDASLVGNGLPRVMRDSQMGVAAAVRMLLDNASVTCGPMLELNKALLEPGQDQKAIGAYQVWTRDDDSVATANVPALRNLEINGHLPELLKVQELFQTFADIETFVNPATGGDMQKGPSEPFRTAAGASMLRGDAALPFKDVVRNFDTFTQSVIGSLVAFNRHFNTKDSIRGDFQVVPRGSTSLIAKEVRGMGYDELARSLTPQEMLYVDWRKLLRERLSVRDMDLSVMVNDAEAKRREDAQAQRQQSQDAQTAELMRAEVRKLLADAVKSLTQSDKNSAAAQTQIWNAILQGLEKNVTVDEVAASRAGGGVPSGIAQQQERPGGEGAAPTTH
jgi:hypothetical protein